MNDERKKKGCFGTVITLLGGGLFALKGATCAPHVAPEALLPTRAVEGLAHVHPPAVELPPANFRATLEVPPGGLSGLPGESRPQLPGSFRPGGNELGVPVPRFAPYPYGRGVPEMGDPFLPPYARGPTGSLYGPGGLSGPRAQFGVPGSWQIQESVLYGPGGVSGPRDIFGRPYGSGVVVVPQAPPRVVTREPTAAELRALFGKLSGDLGQVESLAAKKDWGNLGLHVQRELGPVQLPAEVRQTLDGVQKRGRLLQVLTGLDAQLSAGKSPLLSADERGLLPSSVGKAVDDLAGLGRLKAALGEKWPGKPDAARLEQDLDLYAGVARDGPEAARLREALAAKAAKEGHADVARKLTRDLEKVAPAGGAARPPSPDPFVGPVPESEGGASAAPRQSAREGLPPLEEKVEATAKGARQRATEQVHDQMEVASHELHLALQQVKAYQKRAEQLSREKGEEKKNEPRPDDKPEEAVASALKRPLKPQDRILLQGMLNKGMKTPAIVAQFREMEAPADK